MEYYHSLGSLKSKDMAFILKSPVDFVFMTLKILEHIITWGKSEKATDVVTPYIYVNTDELHRAFIVKSDHIVSFAFPFAIYTRRGSEQIYVNDRSVTLDAALISKATSIANDYKNTKSFADVAKSLDLTDSLVRNAASLFETILSIEPSYMRYDYDKTSSKGLVHPTYHLDVNYTPASTYKLGLYKPATLPKILSILSKTKSCFYLEKYIFKWYSKVKRKIRRYTHKRRS